MFTVYSKPQCPMCDQAKMLLQAKGLDHKVVVLDVGQPKLPGQTYISRTELLEKFPSARTVPQIVEHHGTEDRYVGGFNELKALLAA